MIKIKTNFKKIKNNKACPPSRLVGSRRGFALLYAVMISSIILAITLGVMDVATQEIKFGTSAKDTDDAFFAADTGAECALYYDRLAPTNNAFTGTATMSCAGNTITITSSGSPASFWSFTVPGLGSAGQGCAKVTVDKTTTPTHVISKGYNDGGSSCVQGPNSVERQLELNY